MCVGACREGFPLSPPSFYSFFDLLTLTQTAVPKDSKENHTVLIQCQR
jgi:hypothetical protein